MFFSFLKLSLMFRSFGSLVYLRVLFENWRGSRSATKGPEMKVERGNKKFSEKECASRYIYSISGKTSEMI